MHYRTPRKIEVSADFTHDNERHGRRRLGGSQRIAVSRATAKVARLDAAAPKSMAHFVTRRSIWRTSPTCRSSASESGEFAEVLVRQFHIAFAVDADEGLDIGDAVDTEVVGLECTLLAVVGC